MWPMLAAAAIGAAGKAAQTPPAGPSHADGYSSGTSNARSGFDGSGWTVSTGSSKATGAGLNMNTILILGGIALGAVYLMHRK
ncbi:hypothetical protein [Ralstonia sp. NFACC01]|uniref:hypothetical protein n=1 Tax=Ralstonia sp. NFACC01 TaxID=1566294 RepID=UPI0008EE3718|nr:hypothetical protein [Ralstonia sp. NFACC01]SFQ19244.1 hypothetical protein SAMN03159417_04553 [Ralstonia sp. NFACC01]